MPCGRLVFASFVLACLVTLGYGQTGQTFNGNYIAQDGTDLEKWDFFSNGEFIHEGRFNFGSVGRTQRGRYGVSGSTLMLVYSTATSANVHVPGSGTGQFGGRTNCSATHTSTIQFIGPRGSQGVVIDGKRFKPRLDRGDLTRPPVQVPPPCDGQSAYPSVTPRPAPSDVSRHTGAQISVSPTFASFEHSRYVVRYPDNWKLLGNPQSLVLIAPEGGISGQALNYGVLLDTLPRNNPRAAFSLQDYLTACRHFMAGCTRGRTVSVNGRRGYMGQTIANSDSGGPEMEWLIALPEDQNSTLVVLFVAPAAPGERTSVFESLKPTYEAILRSLRIR